MHIILSPEVIAVITVAIVLIIIFLINYYGRNGNKKIKSGIILVKTNYKSDPDLKIQEDFIKYLHSYAKIKKIPLKPKEDVYKFFIENFERLRYGYVFDTRNVLCLTNIPELIQKATEEYA